VDTAGQPLPGAVISVIAPHGRFAVCTRTDDNGEYAATGLRDGYSVVAASSPRHHPAADQVLVSAAAPVRQDFTLARAGR
jgi:hypothetical protein